MSKNIKTSWKKAIFFLLFPIFSLASFSQNALAEPDDSYINFYVYKPSFYTPEELKKHDGWDLAPVQKDAVVRRDTDLWQHLHENLYYADNLVSNNSFGYIYTTMDKSKAIDWIKDRLQSVPDAPTEGYLYKIIKSEFAIDIQNIYHHISSIHDIDEVPFLRHIFWTQVAGWWKVDANGDFVGEFVKNPDYAPLSWPITPGGLSSADWLAAFPEPRKFDNPDDASYWAMYPWEKYTVEIPQYPTDKKVTYPKKTAYQAAIEFYWEAHNSIRSERYFGGNIF